MNRTNQDEWPEWVESACRFLLGILAGLGWMAFVALVVAVSLTGCAASVEVTSVPEPVYGEAYDETLELKLAPAQPSFRVLTVPRLFVRETCLGSNVVSVLYMGEPGTIFDHEGQPHMIPESGSVELIANERGKWPLETDEFGMIERVVR